MFYRLYALTNSVKALNESESTNPNKGNSPTRPFSIKRFLLEGTLLHLCRLYDPEYTYHWIGKGVWLAINRLRIQILLEATLCNNLRQVVHTYMPVTKQYNLVPAKGRSCCAAGDVTEGLAVVMAAYRRVDDLRPPAGWLPVHQDQLRAQCSVSSMGSLYLFFMSDCPQGYL